MGEEDTTKEGLRTSIMLLKNIIAKGIDGVISEMVKDGTETTAQWIWKVFMKALKRGYVLDEWIQTIIVPQHNGKGSKSDF